MMMMMMMKGISVATTLETPERSDVAVDVSVCANLSDFMYVQNVGITTKSLFRRRPATQSLSWAA